MTAEHLHSPGPPKFPSRAFPIPNLPCPTLGEETSMLKFSTSSVVPRRTCRFCVNLAPRAPVEIVRRLPLLTHTVASFSNSGSTNPKTANISSSCCRSLLRMQGFMPQKLHSSCREHQHAEKNQSVMPTLDVGCSVRSLPVVNWNLNDL